MDFDAPLYKILAHNDTGQAVGHQGGIVIPKDLDPYFPQLSKRVTAEAPAPEEFIVADLFDGATYLETVEARYQYQTWGANRSPERRLTRNLTALRNRAREGDMLVIERSLDDPFRYRLRLIRQDNPEYAAMTGRLEGRRWGMLDPVREPVKETLVEEELETLIKRELEPFTLFDNAAVMQETKQRRIARSRAFQRHVSALYEFECAVCRLGLRHPTGRSETQSAHIVPRHRAGSDDARNGIQLCRSHHWAFDEGLFGIEATFRVIVPEPISQMRSNASLREFHGRVIKLPAEPSHQPHPEALQWHLENTVFNLHRIAQ